MIGRERDEDAPEAVNREQEDEGQAQDVADDALHPQRGGGSVKGNHRNPAQIIPDDVPDLVETMERMVSSGRIDNDAYAGEPQHDDEEELLGDTEDMEDEMIFNEDGEGEDSDDSVDLDRLADNGDDPLGSVASEHGLEDEDEDDDDDDYDDADDDDLNDEDEAWDEDEDDR